MTHLRDVLKLLYSIDLGPAQDPCSARSQARALASLSYWPTVATMTFCRACATPQAELNTTHAAQWRAHPPHRHV